MATNKKWSLNHAHILIASDCEWELAWGCSSKAELFTQRLRDLQSHKYYLAFSSNLWTPDIDKAISCETILQIILTLCVSFNSVWTTSFLICRKYLFDSQFQSDKKKKKDMPAQKQNCGQLHTSGVWTRSVFNIARCLCFLLPMPSLFVLRSTRRLQYCCYL